MTVDSNGSSSEVVNMSEKTGGSVNRDYWGGEDDDDRTETLTLSNGGNDIPPCLLCGDDLTVDSFTSFVENSGVLKVEVEDEEVVTDSWGIYSGGNAQEKFGGQEISSTSGGNNSEEDKCLKWSADEKSLFKRFLKWFQIEKPVSAVKRKKKSIPRYGDDKTKHKFLLEWSADSGEKDPFPFCPSCSDSLMKLQELDRKLEELEKTIKDAVQELKTKAILKEIEFGGKGIYQRDGRYRRVREQIVGNVESRYSNEVCDETERSKNNSKNIPERRRSTRVSRHPNSANCSKRNPVVLLTKGDKANANQHLSVFETLSDDDSEAVKIAGSLTEFSNEVTKQSTTNRASLSPTTSSRKQIKTEEDDVEIGSPLVPMDTDDFSDFNATSPPTPSPEPEKKTTRRRNRRAVKIKKEYILDNDSDVEYIPELPCSSSSPPLERRNPKRKVKIIENDKDWKVATDEEDNSSSSDDDDDNFELEDEIGRKKKSKIIADTENKTLTYKDIVFNQRVPPSDNKYECSICGAVIKHTSAGTSIYHHVSVVHKRGTRKRRCREPRMRDCRICGRPTLCTSMIVHEWSHKNEKEKQSALERGEKRIPSSFKKYHMCDICGHSFSTPSQLLSHKNAIHGDDSTLPERKPELCQECGRSYLNLSEHQKNAHGDNLLKYTCLEEGCGKQFKRLNALTKHKNAVHRKIREFKCTMCPREFYHKVSFRDHMNLHLGVRPWRCDHCSSAFRQKSHLIRHVSIYHSEGSNPRRKAFIRGPTMLPSDVKKNKLISEGKYLPPSALATWAAGREPTSHFPVKDVSSINVNAENFQIDKI